MGRPDPKAKKEEREKEDMEDLELDAQQRGIDWNVAPDSIQRKKQLNKVFHRLRADYEEKVRQADEEGEYMMPAGEALESLGERIDEERRRQPNLPDVMSFEHLR